MEACRQSSIPETHETRLGMVVSLYNTSAGEAETGRDLGATGVKLILFGDLQVQ